MEKKEEKRDAETEIRTDADKRTTIASIPPRRNAYNPLCGTKLQKTC